MMYVAIAQPNDQGSVTMKTAAQPSSAAFATSLETICGPKACDDRHVVGELVIHPVAFALELGELWGSGMFGPGRLNRFRHRVLGRRRSAAFCCDLGATFYLDLQDRIFWSSRPEHVRA